MSGTREPDYAIRFYEAKAKDYDYTWHSEFTKRFVSYLDIKPSQHVLDLACGTGLVSFLEADAVGPNGQVIGIDITPGMLEVAARKKTQDAEKYSNVNFINGDILHLGDISELKGKTFDVITIASALVWFPDPQAAIEHWSEYLKPGGVIAMDTPHPRNLVSGMVLERVARRLELPVPYNRSWSRSESALRDVIESAGLEVEQVTTVDNQAGYGRRLYDVEQWDDFFVENVIVKDVAKIFANNDIRRKAQGAYKEEWEKLAIDGKVEEIDAVFLGIARKPLDGTRYVPKNPAPATGEVVFSGGCRCGGIQYTSSARPSDITLCYCRTCQQVSGSAYLPFIDVPKAAVQFTHSSTSKTLKLSEVAERFFCSDCGAPTSMTYYAEPDIIYFTVATIDLRSLTCETPKVWRHIYLSEKTAWVQLPENDGAERWGTCE